MKKVDNFWIIHSLSLNSPSAVFLEGIAMNSRSLPSITLMSCTTKQLSKVTETTAFILPTELTFRTLTSVICIFFPLWCPHRQNIAILPATPLFIFIIDIVQHNFCFVKTFFKIRQNAYFCVMKLFLLHKNVVIPTVFELFSASVRPTKTQNKYILAGQMSYFCLSVTDGYRGMR